MLISYQFTCTLFDQRFLIYLFVYFLSDALPIKNLSVPPLRTAKNIVFKIKPIKLNKNMKNRFVVR